MATASTTSSVVVPVAPTLPVKRTFKLLGQLAGTASYSASSGCEGDDGVILVWELRPQLQQKKKDD